MSETVLSLQNITKRYPGVTALHQVSIAFHKGEVHALLGENGAGKSTLIKVIAGAVTPDEGKIIIGEHEYSALSPLQAKNEKIEVIYQEFNLVDSLSVAENICFGERTGKFFDRSLDEKKAHEVLTRMGVTHLSLRAQVSSLPPSQKQLVEIAKSISRKAKILIMDEPSAPLSVAEVQNMFKIVRMLKEQGTTIIYITHRMEEIFEIADRVTVMRDGQYVATKDIEQTNVNDLIRMMVGRELSESYPESDGQKGAEVLRVDGLCGNGDNNISFSLHAGEILGLAGLVGSGRTELARLLIGADKIEAGQIRIHGQKVRLTSPAAAIHNRIGLIPEDRKQHGCFLEKNIQWNCSIAALKSLSKRSVVNTKQEDELGKHYQERLNIKTPSMTQLVKNLSGGNQQKVVLAKTLATNSEILIFDEPTRGIDVGAKQEIYLLMRELAKQGKAILMITSDMQELLGMSDRILVLYEGQMAGELPRESFSQDRVLKLASGMQ